MRRDLAVALGGMAAERERDVYTDGDPDNHNDMQSIDRLADNIVFANWKIMDPRPALRQRQSWREYRDAMQSFVDQLVRTYARPLHALANHLESSIVVSGDDAHETLERNGAPRGGVRDALPLATEN
jgi:hypothetical protein